MSDFISQSDNIFLNKNIMEVLNQGKGSQTKEQDKIIKKEDKNVVVEQQKVKQSASKGWQDFTQSQESDQWFDNESKSKNIKKEQAPAEQKQKKKTQKQAPSSQIQKPIKRNYLTDQQIIQKIESKQIPVDDTIKVVRCFNLEMRQILEKLKKRNMTEYKEGYFIINFQNKQDLLNFIKQKIQRNYKFFLQPFVRKQNQRPRQYHRKDNQRLRQDNRRDKQKPRENNRRNNEKPQQNNYNERQNNKKNYQQKNRPNVQKKYAKQQKINVVQKKKQQPFEINENYIALNNEFFNDQLVLNELKRRKVVVHFRKIYIISPMQIIHKAYLLSASIFKSINFGLEQDCESKQKGKQKLVLSQGASGAKVLAIASKFSFSNENQVQLGSKKTNYFSNIPRTNKNILAEGFSIVDYIFLFKQNFKQVFDQWSVWIIQAEKTLIEQLLRLSHEIKKNLDVIIQIKVQMRLNKPYAMLQIKKKVSRY